CERTSTRPSTSAPRGRRWPRSSSRWSPTEACQSSSTPSRSTARCSPSAASPFRRKSPSGERSGAGCRGRRRSGCRAGRDEVLQCRVRDHAKARRHAGDPGRPRSRTDDRRESRPRLSRLRRARRGVRGLWECHGFMRRVDATERQRGFGDYIGYALIAEGKADVYAEIYPEGSGLKPWDLAPCKIIVEEAGGRFTDLEGRPTIYSSSALATN